jgi:iron complex transport system ATP-binding protein
VLHDINQALAGFDRLWLVQNGQVIADLPAGRAALPALEALFGIELRCVELAPGRIAVLAQRSRPIRAQALEQAVAEAAAQTQPA